MPRTRKVKASDIASRQLHPYVVLVSAGRADVVGFQGATGSVSSFPFAAPYLWLISRIPAIPSNLSMFCYNFSMLLQNVAR
jgi:hypothetical protein